MKRYSLFTALIMLFFLGACVNPRKEKPAPKQAEPQVIDTITALEKLQQEVDYFEKEFDKSVFRGHPTKIEGEVVAFSTWATTIETAEKDTSSQVRKLASSFKKKVVAFQVKEFPVLRMDYKKSLGQIVWENDIYVTIQGKGNTILNISGALFASNKNIADTQATLEKQLYNLRFKQVRYRWYKEADEFTYYDLKPPADKELIPLVSLVR